MVEVGIASADAPLGVNQSATLGDRVERQVEAYEMINGAPAATAPSSTGQSHDAKGRERRAFVTSYAKDNLACAKRGGCSRCRR